MDISFGTYNNILDASSITFKKDAVTGLEIKYDHVSSILHLGDKISVEDKVIVNKTFTVHGDLTDGSISVDNGSKNSKDLAIEMNIGDKLVFAHKNSSQPLYLTTNNKNDGALPPDGPTADPPTLAPTAIAYETGVTYISRTTNSGAYDEDTAIATYAGKFTAAQDTRTLQFIPTESGKFYINYYSNGTGIYANFYIPVTVNRPTDRVEQKSRDLSFNENVSVAKKLSVLGNSEFSNHAVFSDVSLNANTFVSNIEVTDSSFANLNCAGETDLSNAFIKVGEVETLTTRNPTISNRIFIVDVDGNSKYSLNDIPSSEVNPVINVGESITFAMDSISVNTHPIIILKGDTFAQGGGQGAEVQHNVDGLMEYHVPGEVSYNQVFSTDYVTNFAPGGYTFGGYDHVFPIASQTQRKAVFIAFLPGTYYYQCNAHANMGGSFTVVDRDSQAEIVNKDLSFNGNIDVDFSSNYVTGENKRMRFIFHPDYTN